MSDEITVTKRELEFLRKQFRLLRPSVHEPEVRYWRVAREVNKLLGECLLRKPETPK